MTRNESSIDFMLCSDKLLTVIVKKRRREFKFVTKITKNKLVFTINNRRDREPGILPVIEMTTTASTDRNIQQEEEEEGDLKGVIIVTTRWRKIIVIIDAFSGIPCITPKTRQASVLLVDADSVSTYPFRR